MWLKAIAAHKVMFTLSDVYSQNKWMTMLIVKSFLMQNHNDHIFNEIEIYIV